MSLDIYARQVFAHIPRWVSIILAYCRYIFHFHRLIFVLYLALCLLIWLNSTVASVSLVAWHTERFHMGEVSGIILGKFLGNCRSHNKTKMFSNPVDKLLLAFRHAIDSWAWITPHSSVPPPTISLFVQLCHTCLWHALNQPVAVDPQSNTLCSLNSLFVSTPTRIRRVNKLAVCLSVCLIIDSTG